MLPGQNLFVSEALVAIDLFWPILLLVLLTHSRYAIIWAILGSIIVFFLHPISIFLFAFLTAAIFVLSFIDRRQEKLRRQFVVFFCYISFYSTNLAPRLSRSI